MTNGNDGPLLTRAASTLAYPPAPDLRPRVLTAIRNQRPAPAPPAVFRPWALAAAAIALFAAAGAAIAVPTSRDALADFFGVEGSKVERLPSPPPGATATPLPEARDIETGATPVPIGALSFRAGFTPVYPVGYGDADAAFIVDYDEITPVILRYERFDLWQAPDGFGGTFGKGLPPDVLLNEVTVGDAPAYWISGGHHIVTFIDSTGREVIGAQRTVDRNTLIWQSDAAFYRIETDLPLADALAIAESLP